MSEEFYIDLNEFSSKKKKLLKNLFWAALVCIILFAASFLFIFYGNKSLEWMPVVSIIYIALYTYFAWLSFTAKLFIKADAYRLEYKFGLFKRERNIILWDTIDKVKIGPAYIALYKKTGRRRVIQLGWLPYAKVIDIKNTLIPIIQILKKPYEIGEIIRYNKRKGEKLKSQRSGDHTLA